MQDLRNLVNNEMELLKLCAKMEYEGVLLDREYVNKSYEYEERKIEEAKQDFEKDTGRTYRDSSKLFAEIFTERGERFPRTEKGNPSFRGDFLERCTSPTASLIHRIRYHEKRANTYFKNFLYYMDNADYIHPSMNQAGTVTGRFSYSNPNLQNVPKEDDPENATNPSNIRRSFICPPKFKLLSIDYDQQEYRLMLDYAGEKKLISKVMQGADVHQATADLLKVSRKQAKTLNFMILYGGGIDKLSAALGCGRVEATRIRNEYFQKLPNVASLLKRVKQKGEDVGFIRNKFGRIYWCPDLRYSYKLPNHLIQGAGADVIKFAMVQMQPLLRYRKSRLVLQVHDELLFYLSDEEEHLVDELRAVMESIYKPFNGMKLTTSASISKHSWSHWDASRWQKEK